jgi:hypothetical protein
MMKGIVGQLQALTGGQAHADLPRSTRAQAAPKSNGGAEPRVSLQALQTAVSAKKARGGANLVPVAGGRVDRTELPLDDDFKEF